MLEVAENLARFHNQHERFYAAAPLETAVRLHRHARALQALADRWAATEPSSRAAGSPYEGAEDLNSAAAIAVDGVLFLEGGDRPAELTAMLGELRTDADHFTTGGSWLASAMQSSWDMAAAALEIDGLVDVMGERHRIISNDLLAAHMQSLVGMLLSRAADMLDRIDLTPAGVRADLGGGKVTPGRMHSAAEVIARAADLCCESAGLVHDNERRWRVFRRRVEVLLGSAADDGGSPGPTGEP
jgi:hypothetical protein